MAKRKSKKRISIGTKLIVILIIISILLGSIFIYSASTGKDFASLIQEAYALINKKDDKNQNNNSSTNDNSGTVTTPGKYNSTTAPSGNTTEVSTLKDLKIHFVDVGQGDCIIIEFPDGKNMIIDAGDDGSKVENAISEYCNSLGFIQNDANSKKFDYLLLTHQDADHAGSIDFVIENYNVGYIFKPNVLFAKTDVSAYRDKTYSDLPSELTSGKTNAEGGTPSTTKTYFKFLVDSYLEGCDVQTFNKDSDFSNTIKHNNTNYTYSIDFLTPTAERNNVAYKNSNNDYSPIIMLEYCGKRVMFVGDAETKAENEFLEYYSSTLSNYNIDVLKVGHHGSDTSSSQEFINAIDPEYSIIQVGFDNTHNHPVKSTLTTLSGSTIYRNDTNGNIVLNLSSTENLSNENFILKNTDCSQNHLSGPELVTERNEELGFEYYNYYKFGYFLHTTSYVKKVVA